MENGFWQAWQNLPSQMSPVIFKIGSFGVHWYGLMYILAFVTVYFLVKIRLKQEPTRFPWDLEFLKNLMTWSFVGVLLGGRFGYVFFYNFHYYMQHPLEIIFPFNLESGRFTGISGMSYHGGMIGAFVGGFLFCRKHKVNYWNLVDLFTVGAPLGYTFGRLGNFINGELYGRVTSVSWGMFFPQAPTMQLRHASQLYEGLFEGVVLFFILWSLRKVKLPEGSMLGLYLIGYGFFRFFIEFFREPDAHLGFVALRWMTMGQVLCSSMILAGFIFLGVAKFRAIKTKS